MQEILEVSGEKDISIRKIADELGCSSAALYRYFSSKDELIYYLLSKGKKLYLHIYEVKENKLEKVDNVF